MILKLIKTAKNLDIYDLNYSVSSEKLGVLDAPKSATSRQIPRHVLICFILFFWLTLRSFWVEMRSPKRKKIEESVFLFASSTNQKNSLLPLLEYTEKNWQWVDVSHLPTTASNYFPLFLAHILALPFLPFVLSRYWSSHGYKRRSFSFAFDTYWLTYGYYIAAHIWLRKWRPKAILVANDHLMPFRTVCQVASELDIPTLYLQHAPVTSSFPALRFDYAFLNGTDALAEYEQCGFSQTKVFLTGSPKFDKYANLANRSETIHSIGICLNGLDPTERIEELVTRLINQLPDLNFVLRPHPRDTRMDKWKTLANEFNIVLSDANTQLSYEFMQDVDAIIAGDSGIIVEAILMNVYPIYYDYALEKRDNYGYIKKDVVVYHASTQDVVDFIQKNNETKPNMTQNAQRYCASIGTQLHGKVGQYIVDATEKIGENESIDDKLWELIPDTSLNAHQLIA